MLFQNCLSEFICSTKYTKLIQPHWWNVENDSNFLFVSLEVVEPCLKQYRGIFESPARLHEFLGEMSLSTFRMFSPLFHLNLSLKAFFYNSISDSWSRSTSFIITQKYFILRLQLHGSLRPVNWNMIRALFSEIHFVNGSIYIPTKTSPSLTRNIVSLI